MRRLILTLLFIAVACTCPRTLAANIAIDGPDNLTITLEGTCPGRVVLRYEGAIPDRWAALAFSREEGEFLLPGGPCWGTLLGLSSSGFAVLRTFRTGSDGGGQLVGRAAAWTCGGFLQLVVQDSRPCQTSNVVQIPQ